MSDQFGLTGGIASGAQPQPRPHHRADTRRDSKNSVTGDYSSPPVNSRRQEEAAAPFIHLKRGRIAQAVLDVIAVFVTFLFVASVGLSLPLAIFLMFFAAF